MNHLEATAIASTLRHGDAYAEVVGARIRFVSPLTGTHSLNIYVSSEVRVRAHWLGFVAEQSDRRLTAPKVNVRPALVLSVGCLVFFPSGSARSGQREGVVTRIGPKRAVVAYTFKHGGKSTKAVPIGDLRVTRNAPR